MPTAPRAVLEDPRQLEEELGFDLLVFRISRSRFGVCLDQIREIEEVEEFVRLTAADPSLRGVLVARDRPIPMVDVARRLGLAAATRYRAPVLLVARIGDAEVGFLVDDPEDVITVRARDLQPLPELVARARRGQAVYATAVTGADILLLLDIQSLVSPAEASDFAARALDRIRQVEGM